MSGKEYVLKMLEEHRGFNVSGKQLGDALNLSRTAIWKYIDQLRRDGYQIEAIRNKGYCLSVQNDVLSKEAIGLYLENRDLVHQIQVHKTIDSTNLEAKKLAIEGAIHGTVVIAEHQRAGKGRMGRTFYSPANSGIYMSLILRPQESIQDALLITVAACVAVCEAIEECTGIWAQIKWVNDIYINGKKLAGILTEAATNFENGEVEYIVLGIGINVGTMREDFPEELQQIAGSLQEHTANDINRNELIGTIINRVLTVSENLSDKTYFPSYVKRSCVIGEVIQVITTKSTTDVLAIGIDEGGGLRVQNNEGDVYTLNSGEISIRRK
ncbi:MAG: biotin--[acetyl-CoA-carboxylase] ligase [Turicibacter sp.]